MQLDGNIPDTEKVEELSVAAELGLIKPSTLFRKSRNTFLYEY